MPQPNAHMARSMPDEDQLAARATVWEAETASIAGRRMAISRAGNNAVIGRRSDPARAQTQSRWRMAAVARFDANSAIRTAINSSVTLAITGITLSPYAPCESYVPDRGGLLLKD